MCDILNERIRINAILSEVVASSDRCFADLDELVQACITALFGHYDGACPDECLTVAARDFASRHFAPSDAAKPPPPALSSAA